MYFIGYWYDGSVNDAPAFPEGLAIRQDPGVMNLIIEWTYIPVELTVFREPRRHDSRPSVELYTASGVGLVTGFSFRKSTQDTKRNIDIIISIAFFIAVKT